MDLIERYNRYIGSTDFEFNSSLEKKYRIGDKASIILDLDQELSGFTDIIVDIFVNNTYIESLSKSGNTLTIQDSSILFELTTSIYPIGDIVSKIKLIDNNIYDKEIIIIIGEIYP